MPDFDWNRIQRSKSQHRDVLVALPPDRKQQIIERLRDEGLAMKRMHYMHAAGPIPSIAVESGTAILLNVIGANATLVAAVTAQSNPTAANTSRLNRTR